MKRKLFQAITLCVIAVGCQKGTIETGNVVIKDAKNERLSLLTSLETELRENELSASREIVDPINSSNPFENYGIEFKNSLLNINASELSDPSATVEEYQAKWDA